MTDITREAVEKLAEILDEKARGERNAVGDQWGDWLCEDAATAIRRLLRERDEALLREACAIAYAEEWEFYCKEADKERDEALEHIHELLRADQYGPASAVTEAQQAATAFLAKHEKA